MSELPEARTPKRVNNTGSNHNTPPPPSTVARPQPMKRLYRTGEQKWVTREIASLDFLLGIPLAGEQDIVKNGFQMQLTKQDEDAHSEDLVVEPMAMTKSRGAWWEKWIPSQNHIDKTHGRTNSAEELLELERPTPNDQPISYAPGRRLDGDEATRVKIPLAEQATTLTQQKSIARQSTIREWELKTAHGLGKDPPLLDGRIFFSADYSYPVAIYSCIRYAPSKYELSHGTVFSHRVSLEREEAAVRRRKLEAIGGGGTQFIIPNRDWRGISYVALF